MREMNDKAPWRERIAAVITFKYLTPSELDVLMDKATVVSCGEGEAVVREDEVSPYFFAILDGSVNVTVDEASLDGSLRSVYICTLGRGDVFGEAGIFIKVKRTATVCATEGTTLLRLHREDVSAFIRDNPRGGNKFLLVVIHSLLRKLRAANQELAFERKSDMDQGDVDGLIAEMLGNG